MKEPFEPFLNVLRIVDILCESIRLGSTLISIWRPLQL